MSVVATLRFQIHDTADNLVVTLMREMRFGINPTVGHSFFPGSFGLAASKRFGLYFAIDSIEHGAVPADTERQPEVHVVVRTKYRYTITDEDMAELASDGWHVMDCR
ncbi:hypothetical protein [Arachnia propionica]|uniref:Uncharacterized protein n=1 Tax=Arachnia propionica TaxID=1750 RepID=A0A3P1WVF0_9ACTN|nr:hypothetical protein [Arachnia propionica]RRD50201.1 hypothetical protein EII35_05520 [Arachnia propionica]